MTDHKTTHTNDMKLTESMLTHKLFVDLMYTQSTDDLTNTLLFSYANFKMVLKRCKKLNIGILGIETWSQKKSWIGIRICEEYMKHPTDESWYWQAFYELSELTINLYFRASFDLPADFIERDKACK